MCHILLLHVRKDGRQIDEIEFVILERKLVFGGLKPSMWVVLAVLYIRQLKSKIRVARREMILAPSDAPRNDVDSLIAPFCQILRQRSCHPSDSATNIQYSVLRSQFPQLNEVPQKFISCIYEIPISSKVQVTRRDQFLATAEKQIQPI